MGMKDDPKTVELKPGATATTEITGKPAAETLNLKITVASDGGEKDKKEKRPLRGLQAFRNA